MESQRTSSTACSSSLPHDIVTPTPDKLSKYGQSLSILRPALIARAEEEDVKIAEPALDLLVQIGRDVSLRYALNLIAPCHLLAQRRKSLNVELDDVKMAYRYFLDVERSAAYAKETTGMMFGETEVIPNGNHTMNGPVPMEVGA